MLIQMYRESSDLGDLYEIQENNRPFSRAFQAVVHTLNDISVKLDMSPIETIGFVYQRLDMPGYTPNEDTCAFRFEVDDPQVVRFYHESQYKPAQLTMKITKLILDSGVTDLSQLCFQIKHLGLSYLSELSHVERNEQLVSSTKTNVVYQQPVQQPVKKQTTKKKKPVKKDTKVKKEQPASKKVHSPTPTTTRRKKEIRPRVAPIKSQFADELDDVTSAASTVTVNPLLNNFIDK